MEFLANNRIKVEVPKRPKKITGTRLGAVMGVNRWNSPFKAWCEITRTYEEPFEGSKYTEAGKVIEPKIGEYLRSRYFLNVKSPEDVYGKDYFKKTFGDFYPKNKIFGGMWDFLGNDFIVEVKTTKRIEDWRDDFGKIEPPIYYKLQAALYARLLGFNKVLITCSVLEESDYDNPELFVPSLENTIIYVLNLDDFPEIDTYMKVAEKWWHDHVETGISPMFNDEEDSEILKVLRTKTVDVKQSLSEIIAEAETLQKKIDDVKAGIEVDEKRLKVLTDAIKKELQSNIGENDKNAICEGSSYTWSVRKDVGVTFDSKAFAKDNKEMYDRYSKESVKYVLTKKLKEKEN